MNVAPITVDLFAPDAIARLPGGLISLSNGAGGLEVIGLVALELAIGLGAFWTGQWVYRKLVRRMTLAEELFVKDNVAAALALVGFYLGIAIALSSVFSKTLETWLDRLVWPLSHGLLAIGLMTVGAWLGDRYLWQRFDANREILEEQNPGAAAVEAGFHVAHGLILYAALAGDGGTWLVALACWLLGLATLIGAGRLYPRLAGYNVFGEIHHRNNLAAGIALAGWLVGLGNGTKAAFAPEFVNWGQSFSIYGGLLLASLLVLWLARQLTDWLLVPGVTIADEIAHQAQPNVGAALVEAVAYVALSLLIGGAIAGAIG